MMQHDAPGPRPVVDYSIQPRRKFPGIAGWLLLVGVAVIAFLMFRGPSQTQTAIAMSDFDMLLRSGSIRLITVSPDGVSGELSASTTLPNGTAVTEFRAQLPTGMGASFEFMQYLLSNRGRATIRVDNAQNLALQILLPLAPWVLIFAFIWFFVFRNLRNPRTSGSTNLIA